MVLMPSAFPYAIYDNSTNTSEVAATIHRNRITIRNKMNIKFDSDDFEIRINETSK